VRERGDTKRREGCKERSMCDVTDRGEDEEALLASLLSPPVNIEFMCVGDHRREATTFVGRPALGAPPGARGPELAFSLAVIFACVNEAPPLGDVLPAALIAAFASAAAAVAAEAMVLCISHTRR
jgi:hypothetical protein